MNDLGILEKVPLRDEWVHEAHAFTKWLAKEENLTRLGDEIGVEMELIETESGVGSFSADILAKDVNSDRKIVIENQLERTDHDHLGKIITYASGKRASFIIWVVAAEREEHKMAIDWLNEHTDEEVSFFLVRMELWKIGDSARAPKFVVVSQPNGWAKASVGASGSSAVTETKMIQLRFWESMREWGQNQALSLKLSTPYPQHWYDISSGSSRWHLTLTVNTKSGEMTVQVYIPNDDELFNVFYENREFIEQKFGHDLNWMDLPGKKAARIKISQDGDIYDESKWETYFAWMLGNADQMKKAFSQIKIG